MEFKGPTPIVETEKRISNSKEAIVIKNLMRKLGNEGTDLTGKGEVEIRELLASARLLPGTTIDSVIEEMKRDNLITPEKKDVPPSPKIIKEETVYTKLEGIRKVEDNTLTELATQRLQNEAERKAKRVAKINEEIGHVEQLERDIFKSPKDLDLVYVQALALNNEAVREKPEHYAKFAEAGLIAGGQNEVNKDLQDLALRQEQFKEKQKELEPSLRVNIEKNAKIASIVEQALAYGVTNHKWYGDNVTITPASKYDDIKRGVDDVLEISKTVEGSDVYMGLGIDVTYNGLLSEKYRDKFERLLESIRVNKQTKIKYFTNQKGELMPEFTVPKIVLHFDGQDVKELAHFVKYLDDSKVQENFKESDIKFDVLNQILVQCEILGNFATECKNVIAQDYLKVSQSINDLAKKDVIVQQSLDSQHSNETTDRLQYILQKFKEMEMTQVSVE